MPTPPSGLVTALRTGTVARHTLLDLDHASGPVRVWNGLGEIVFGGNTYSGVGALAQVRGIGEARDLQNHEITLLLSGITLTALSSVNPSVRGRVASVYYIWLDETGTQVASKTMFAGYADNLQILPDEATASMLLTLRSPIANWSDIPARTYTSRDQQRIYAGDTGFDLVSGLANATVSGWGPTAESTGGYVVTSVLGGTVSFNCRDSITGALVGSRSLGVMTYAGTNYGGNSAATTWGPWEETSHAVPTRDASKFMLIGSNRVTIDINGFVQSAAGLFLEAAIAAVGQGTGSRLSRITSITALTGATATTITHGGASNWFKKTGATGTGFRDKDAIIDNFEGPNVTRNSGTGAVQMVDRNGVTQTYKEDVTGAAVTATSGGTMQVGGSNCVMDSSGAVRSPGGRKIVIPGAESVNFLRVWT